jgi:uncharacterized protein (TIGR03083 family)
MGADLDYLEHLGRETTRFTDVLEGAAPDARVPSCPGWDVDDLIWHVAEVQWFWGQVVGRRLVDPADVDALGHPDRPTDREQLRDFQHLSGRELHNVLAQTPPDTVCWSWAPEQTAGFSRRRQAHEILIHRVDAELAAGRRSPIDPALAADGVDEMLTLMYAADEPVPADAPVVEVRTGDTADRWWVQVGGPVIGLAVSREEQASTAEISGLAADLDCWLWNRAPVGEIRRSGDPRALDALDEVLARGVH